MKNKILFLFLFWTALTVSQTYVSNIEMFRGDKHTFEFSNLPYDISADKITFVVKTQYGTQYPRIIYKRNNVAGGDSSQIYVSYKKPFSKIYITLKPNETEDLANSKYVFDIVRTNATDSTNTKTLFVGNLNLKNVVSTPWDGVDLSDSGRVFAVLEEADFHNEFAVWDSINGFWVHIPIDSVITLLNIAAAQIPDSVVFSSEVSNMATTNTTQDITGEKTFSNSKTVFSGDSVFINKRLRIGTISTAGQISMGFLTLWNTNGNITQSKTLNSSIKNTMTNDLGSVDFGLESNVGGGITSTTSPYSLVFSNTNGYSLHFASGGVVLSTLDLPNNKMLLSLDTLVFGQNLTSSYTLSSGVIKADTLNLVGNIRLNGNLLTAGGSVSNADSLGGLPAIDYVTKAGINTWSTNLYSGSGNVMRLGKSYADRRFNNGAYSDVWIIDYVVPPYNLSASWLFPIEHRTDYYNDTLQTISGVANLLKVDGTGTPLWKTTDVNISGTETQLSVGDLPDSTTLIWANTGLYGSKITLTEENLTATPKRFPMKVKGYSFDIGTNAYYTYPELYSFYSNLATGDLETAYHFYGEGDYPSYFGGNILTDGYIRVQDSIIIGSSTVKIYPDSITVGGTRLAKITESGDLSTYWDSTEVKNYVNLTTEGDTLSYPAEALDSLMVGLDGGTIGQIPRKKSNARFDLEYFTPNYLTNTDIQLFIDTLYRSNDTIYFVQEDGSTLFFVDNNTGGDLSTYWDSTEVKDYVTVITEGDTSIYTLAEMDSLLTLAGTALQGNQTITLSGDVTGSGTTAITTTIATGSVAGDELASTAVTPGSYTNTNITVDADGRITAASNGSGGALPDSVVYTSELNAAIDNVNNSGDSRVPYLWAHAQLDTTGNDPNFPDSTNTTTSTLIPSKIRAVSQDVNYGVGKVYNITSSEYRVKYDFRGTPTWSNWSNSQTATYYKGIDSIQVRDTSSSSNSTSLDFIFYIAGVTDTFRVTTIASGAFNPEDLNPVVNLYYDSDSLVVSGSKTVASFTYNNRVFNSQDTTTAENKTVQTDSSLYFAATGVKRLNWTYQSGTEFELGTSDFSFEYWHYYPGVSTGMSGGAINKNWQAGIYTSGGKVSPSFLIYSPAQDSTTWFFLNMNVDSLEAGWHHIVITGDRDGDRKIYVDSVLATATEDYHDPAAATWDYFKAQNLVNAYGMTLGWQGLGHFATIRYYKTLISPAQVKQLYEYGLSNGRR